MKYTQLFIDSEPQSQPEQSVTAAMTACPIQLLLASDWKQWRSQQSITIQNQLCSLDFQPRAGHYALLLDTAGQRQLVVQLLANEQDYLAVGELAAKLPQGSYYLLETGWSSAQLAAFALGWGLGGYVFDDYLGATRRQELARRAQLVFPAGIVSADRQRWQALLAGSFWVRDLINQPCEALYPEQLAVQAQQLADRFTANCQVITGAQLTQEFPAVAMVGRGSDRAPCLIEINWHRESDYARDFRLVLVGKGVCFDAGGLDLKGSSSMFQMKKDMAGAAHAMGLAQIIMALQLPIQLWVLIPAVENLPSGSAMKVRDIIHTRSGLNVEVGNTDAEGRLILADALSYAVEQQPDLVIDFATLTGAARVALGMDMAALFSNNDQLATQLVQCMTAAQEPVWQLPLYQPYARFIKAELADLSNTTHDSGISGGAITAALFLQQFVQDCAWMHLDFNGDNVYSSAGRPKGGEAICLRGMLAFLIRLVQQHAQEK